MNLKFDDGSIVYIYKNLILVESTEKSTCVGGIAFVKSREAFTFGIFDIGPTSDQTVINYFQIGNTFLSSNIFVKNSGLKNGLESSNLIILYDFVLYIWDWKSGYTNARVSHSLSEWRIHNPIKFEIIPGTESVFFLVGRMRTSIYSINDPRRTIFDFSKLYTLGVCISPTGSTTKNNFAIFHSE